MQTIKKTIINDSEEITKKESLFKIFNKKEAICKCDTPRIWIKYDYLIFLNDNFMMDTWLFSKQIGILANNEVKKLKY